MTVVHDEFGKIGIEDLQGFMEEGALVVDVMGMFEGDGGRWIRDK